MTNPRPRDFVLTVDGLWFAVTDYHHPPGFVLASLRYVPRGKGFVKVASVAESYALLEKHFPEYLLDESILGFRVQAAPKNRVKEIASPRKVLRHALRGKPDECMKDACCVAGLLSARSRVPIGFFGLTGSVLAGVHGKDSDVDLVVYGIKNFARVRDTLGFLILENKLREPSEEEISKAYHSRGYPEIFSLKEFRHHLLRKKNSVYYGGRKVDLMCVRLDSELPKQGPRVYGEVERNRGVEAVVVGDELCFDFPAVYGVKSEKLPALREVVSYRNAYVGQAFLGERITARGKLERVREKGRRPWLRLVVGTVDEEREYVKLAST